VVAVHELAGNNWRKAPVTVLHHIGILLAAAIWINLILGGIGRRRQAIDKSQEPPP
jgi:hypothetical protein